MVVIIHVMYCRNICDVLFPLLHKNCAKLELLITCNGLGIFCHSIINHFHNVAITVNLCTFRENSALSKLKLWLPPFNSCYLTEQCPRTPLRAYPKYVHAWHNCDMRGYMYMCLGGCYIMVWLPNGGSQRLEWVEFSVSIHIFTVIAKLCKWLIMEWQEIRNSLHIIRSSSIAVFMQEKGCHRYIISHLPTRLNHFCASQISSFLRSGLVRSSTSCGNTASKHSSSLSCTLVLFTQGGSAIICNTQNILFNLPCRYLSSIV